MSTASRRLARFVHNQDCDGLWKAGEEPDRNGLTRVGRTGQKHGDRAGSLYPRPPSSTAGKNASGSQILRGILNSSARYIKGNRYGGNDIWDLNTGAPRRYDGNGTFIGFL